MIVDDLLYRGGMRLVVLWLIAGCGRIGFDEQRPGATIDAPAVCGPEIDFSVDPKHCGTCGHDCLGGDCNAGRCSNVTLATDQGDLRQPVVDDKYLYYGIAGRVRRISKETRAIEDVATYNGLAFRMTQTVDYVYWVTRNTGLVARAVKKPNQGAAEVIATGQGDVGGIASNDTFVYWDNYPTGGRIYGQRLGDILPAELTPPLDDLSAIRLVDNTLYFMRDTLGLFSMSSGGGPITTIAPGVGSWEMAVDGDNVYLASADKLSILRVSIASGTVTRVTEADGPWGIVVDDTHVYFANEDGGTIARAIKTGGPAEILAQAVEPVGVAVDNRAVYWTTRGGFIGMRAK